MLFKNKKKAPAFPRVQLFAGDRLLYDGNLKDLPLKESVIIEKSIYFFDDPEPCYIHRGAVQARLTEELRRELQDAGDSRPGPLLLAWADYEQITKCRLTGSDGFTSK